MTAATDTMPALPEPNGYIGACNHYCLQPKDSPLMPEKLNRWTAHQVRAYGHQCIESTAAELARLQAECEALRKDAEWRPIETAPTDGSMFLCWVSAERWSSPDGSESSHAHDVSQVDFCWWRNGPKEAPDAGYFDNASGQIGDSQAVTHWVPIPAPPAALSTSTAPSGAEE